MQRLDTLKLFSDIVNILLKNNVPDNQARIIADCMISADSRGVHSHGVNMLGAYVKKLSSSSYNLEGEPEIIKETPAFASVDARNMIGMYSAHYCMSYAIEKCKASGIYYVFSKNSNTFGPGFYYTKMAAEQGKIGIAFSNTPTAMPAWGGKEKMLGTNPFSMAIPAKTKPPIILDMATSAVAKSKINEIRKAGGKIPEGWALDKEGNPTTDPQAAIEGLMLPMAQHKGYGIALMIDILAGVVSGAGFLNGVNRFYSEENACMNVGQCFIAIDPVLIHSENFYRVIDDYIHSIHKSGEDVLLPGEREAKMSLMCEEEGVELSEETVDMLNKLYVQYNI